MSKTTVTHDVVATIGEYTNAEGEIKKRYINLGVCFTNSEGNMSIKLNAMPVSPEWSGFLSLYEKKENHQQRPPAEPHRQEPASSQAQNHPMPAGDDIPFMGADNLTIL